MAGQFLGWEVDVGEKVLLQCLAELEVVLDMKVPRRIIVAVAFDDVVHTLVQSDDLVMAHTLVSVIDKFLDEELTLFVAGEGKIPENNMFADDLTHLRISQLLTEILSKAGMVAGVVQAGGLGDIMKQSTGQNQTVLFRWQDSAG